MAQHKVCNQLLCRSGNGRVHAIIYVDYSITASYIGNSTLMTASNIDDLHKFPLQNLEREILVNCWVLQASHVRELLQDEQLSSPNECV